jgi:predicted ArsR family transcriptional regulator
VLQQILRLISQRGVDRQDQLAMQLGVSDELVAEMLAQLAKRGYLTEAELCATGTACESCGLSQACGATRALRIWSLTDKGLRAAGVG